MSLLTLRVRGAQTQALSAQTMPEDSTRLRQEIKRLEKSEFQTEENLRPFLGRSADIWDNEEKQESGARRKENQKNVVCDLSFWILLSRHPSPRVAFKSLMSSLMASST
jgi:hypothetical protein